MLNILTENGERLYPVDFEGKCPTCVHWNKTEMEYPCFDCLLEPLRDRSVTPYHYRKKKQQ